MSNTSHAWFSEQMYHDTHTLYEYKNEQGDKIKGTIISKSNKTPMCNTHTSIYTDFVYVGEVKTHISTHIDTTFRPTFQKKFKYPKPLSY